MPDGIAGGLDGNIKVNFEGLNQGSADIKKSAQLIEGELTDLKKKIGKLVNSWTGQAAEDYQQHQAKWDQAAGDLQQVLAAIGTAVAQAGQDYFDGERNNANRWIS
jgi:early secretory antigenic target protein ESAT-6